MRGQAFAWSEEELAWLEENRAWPRRQLHEIFVILFQRHEVPLDAIKSLMHRRGWTTGRTGCFEKGIVPANKGKRCPEGVGGRHPNARRTQFKKGAKPHTYKGPGHERIDPRDGYVIIIVDEPNPWTGASTRPVHKHRHLWEKANGPIPKGHFLKCIDGDKTNTDPSNWQLLPRSVLPRLNGGPRGRHLAYDQASPEVRPTLVALAQLEQQRRRVRKPRRGRS